MHADSFLTMNTNPIFIMSLLNCEIDLEEGIHKSNATLFDNIPVFLRFSAIKMRLDDGLALPGLQLLNSDIH